MSFSGLQRTVWTATTSVVTVKIREDWAFDRLRFRVRPCERRFSARLEMRRSGALLRHRIGQASCQPPQTVRR